MSWIDSSCHDSNVLRASATRECQGTLHIAARRIPPKLGSRTSPNEYARFGGWRCQRGDCNGAEHASPALIFVVEAGLVVANFQTSRGDALPIVQLFWFFRRQWQLTSYNLLRRCALGRKSAPASDEQERIPSRSQHYVDGNRV